jgi:hypothetical protein
MLKDQQAMNANLFVSNFQTKDERTMSLYLRALYKDLLTNNKLSKVTFCKYLDIPYFLCNRILNRCSKQELHYIVEADFYHLIKSIYLSGYADILEVLFGVLGPDGDNLILKPNDVKILLRHIDGSKDYNHLRKLDIIVDETFKKNGSVMSFSDFARITEFESSGLFLYLVNFFMKRKPFNDQTFRYISKLPYRNASNKSRFFISRTNSQSFFIYPSDMTLTLLSDEVISTLTAHKLSQSTYVTCCFYNTIPTEVDEHFDADEVLGDVEEDTSTNLIPVSLKINNCFYLQQKCLTDIKSDDSGSICDTMSECFTFRRSNINYLINTKEIYGEQTTRLHVDKTESSKFIKSEQSYLEASTRISNITSQDSLIKTENKITYENHIYKFNKKKGRIQKFWITMVSKDIFYFKDSNTQKLKGFHNITDSYLINDEPVSEEIKREKVFYFKLHMRSNIKTYYFKSYKLCQNAIGAFRIIIGQYSINDDYKLDVDSEQIENVKICKGVNKVTGEKVVIKLLPKVNNEMSKSIMNEIDITSRCNNINVVKCYGVYEDSQRVYLVLEHLNQDNLTEYLVRQGSFLTEVQILEIILQVAQGIKYLHSIGIVHRDIKPDNIGISNINGQVVAKVVDFGLSEVCFENEILTEPCGTIYFCAPEIIKRKYTNSADIWSFGILICYLFFGRIPFKNADNVHDFNTCLQNLDIDKFLSKFNGEMSKKLIKKCLIYKPKQRISIKQFIEYLKSINEKL